MSRLSEQGNPMNLVTLQESLERHEELERQVALPIWWRSPRISPSAAANISAYAEIVRERAVVREMISVATQIAEYQFDPQGRNAADCWMRPRARSSRLPNPVPAPRRASASQGGAGEER